jgi:Domain of unknown function (DUF4160)
MPTIAIVDGVMVMIYPRDHAPPHIHASIAEYHCKLAILDGAVLDGKLPPRKLVRLRNWLAEHRGEVSNAWFEIASGRSFKGKIG